MTKDRQPVFALLERQRRARGELADQVRRSIELVSEARRLLDMETSLKTPSGQPPPDVQLVQGDHPLH